MNRKNFFKLLGCCVLAPVAAAKAFSKRKINFRGRMTEGVTILNEKALAKFEVSDYDIQHSDGIEDVLTRIDENKFKQHKP